MASFALTTTAPEEREWRSLLLALGGQQKEATTNKKTVPGNQFDSAKE